MQVEADEILTPFDGAEAQEGVRAFLEKRSAILVMCTLVNRLRYRRGVQSPRQLRTGEINA
jgi:hypothetical protein